MQVIPKVLYLHALDVELYAMQRYAGLCLTVTHTDSRSQAAPQQFIQTVCQTFLLVKLI